MDVSKKDESFLSTIRELLERAEKLQEKIDSGKAIAPRTPNVKVSFGNGTTDYGPGVNIDLTGDQVATAIDAYLVSHGIHISGPRTTSVNGDQCETGRVYVDPSGFAIVDGIKWEGRGKRGT